MPICAGDRLRRRARARKLVSHLLPPRIIHDEIDARIISRVFISHFRSARKLTFNEAPVVTVIGKAFREIGHASSARSFSESFLKFLRTSLLRFRRTSWNPRTTTLSALRKTTMNILTETTDLVHRHSVVSEKFSNFLRTSAGNSVRYEAVNRCCSTSSSKHIDESRSKKRPSRVCKSKLTRLQRV